MSETTMNVAKVIASQIGGKALYMIGAKNLVATDKGLDFKIGRNAKGVTHVSIVLTPDDTYDVEFVRCNVRAKEMRKMVSSIEGAYFDMLRDVIANHTGMDLSL